MYRRYRDISNLNTFERKSILLSFINIIVFSLLKKITKHFRQYNKETVVLHSSVRNNRLLLTQVCIHRSVQGICLHLLLLRLMIFCRELDGQIQKHSQDSVLNKLTYNPFDINSKF